MRRLKAIIWFAVASFITLPSSLALAQDPVAFSPHVLVADEDMLDVSSMDISGIQAFLSRGSLAKYRARDVDGTERTAAQIIQNASSKFGLSPKFLLALLQKEQSLVEDDDPTQDQLDWAMGYAICDDCSKSDPRLQKFRGFARQVYSAAKKIRNSYLSDLARRGYTETRVGPGRETVIDGTHIVPANNATAVLYTYTPHLSGNRNFAAIWQKWFASSYPSGTLLQDNTTGGVWLIQRGERRAITSRAALVSRFNASTIVQVAPSVINVYPAGKPISFPNYSLLRSPRGTVYLIVDDMRRGFDSREAFRAAGFLEDEIVDVAFDDLSSYTEGKPITVASVKPEGILMQDKTTGGVYYVKDGTRHPIPSREILANRFAGRPIYTSDPRDLERYSDGEPVAFQDGILVGLRGSSDIYVIENGTRRHVADEATFITYGWKWSQVVWTDNRSLALHPVGEPLDTTLAAQDVDMATSAR